jgi:hypothetical protein
MTSAELRARLGGRGGRFTLSMADLKDRLGLPDEIRLMRKWCRDTGRDVARLIYKTDDGELEVFCPMGFLNGEEAALDGWVMAGAPSTAPPAAADPGARDPGARDPGARDPGVRVGGLPPQQLPLFESGASEPEVRASASNQEWRAIGQMSLEFMSRRGEAGLPDSAKG